MVGCLCLAPSLAVYHIVMCVGKGVDVLASQLLPYRSGVVALPQVRSLGRPLVRLVDDVVGSATLVGIANLVLILHLVDPLLLSALLFFHVLPPLQIPLVLLDSSRVYLLLFDLVPLLPLGLLDRGEIAHKSVIRLLKVAARWVWIVHKHVVDVLIKVANLISQSFLVARRRRLAGCGLLLILHIVVGYLLLLWLLLRSASGWIRLRHRLRRSLRLRLLQVLILLLCLLLSSLLNQGLGTRLRISLLRRELRPASASGIGRLPDIADAIIAVCRTECRCAARTDVLLPSVVSLIGRLVLWLLLKGSSVGCLLILLLLLLLRGTVIELLRLR